MGVYGGLKSGKTGCKRGSESRASWFQISREATVQVWTNMDKTKPVTPEQK
jgi:predicted Fe-S protein YdhL (DUF1289 family)